MNRKSSFALTRNLKQGLQERQGAPIQGVDLLPLMSGSSSALRGALFNEFVPHNHLQATTSAGSCNFSTFTVAIQIERSFMAIVAKEEESSRPTGELNAISASPTRLPLILTWAFSGGNCPNSHLPSAQQASAITAARRQLPTASQTGPAWRLRRRSPAKQWASIDQGI